MSNDWARQVELTTENLTDLIENRVAAIRLPGFATMEECRAFSAAVGRTSLQYYKVGRPAGYVGTTFIHYMNRPKRDYFDEAASARSAVRTVTDQSFDHLARFIDTVQQKTDYSIAVADEPDYGSYFAGIIRILCGGNNVHIDFAPQFAKDHVVGEVTAQLTWNVYVDEPRSGGETIIWNKPWIPTGNPEEDSKYPHFTREELQDVDSFVFKAQAGDVMIFNSRNPHQVEITTDVQKLNRIGAGSFIGRAGARDLVLWS